MNLPTKSFCNMYANTTVNVLYSLLDIFVCTLSAPIPMPARSKAWVCCHSPPGIVGSNRSGDLDVCLF